MKKLLLASLMFLTSCNDRYDFVRDLESELPGVNVEAFTDNYYVATYQEKTVLISTNKRCVLKLANSEPESRNMYVNYHTELVMALKKLFNIVEEVK